MASAPRPARDPEFDEEKHYAADESNQSQWDETAHQADSFAPIYLSGLSWDHSYHPLDLLARLMMLTVYGTAGMTERTRYEVRIAALMLGIVFCFELAAWSFVFRQFADSGGWETAMVLAAALLVSLAMTMLERSILVADMDVSGLSYFSVWIKIGCRLAIILFVAFRITSQPVELVAFRSSIESRMFQEDVRRNLVSAATSTMVALQEMEDRMKALTDFKDGARKGDPREVVVSSKFNIKQIQQKIDQADAHISSWQGEINGKTRAQSEARRRLGQLDAQLTRLAARPPTDDLQREETRLRDAETQASREVRQLSNQISRLEGEMETANGEKDRLADEKSKNEFILQNASGNSNAQASDASLAAIPTVKDFDELGDSYKSYVSQLLQAKAASDVKPSSPFQFVRRDYNDVERLVIVQDFLDSRPPFATHMDFTTEQQRIAKQDLKRYQKKSVTLQQDETDQSHFEQNVENVFDRASQQLITQGNEDARRMQFIAVGKYWMILGIAIVVPMVALIYKVTAGKELKNYYSVQYQAGSFQPEALFQATTEEFIRREKELRKREEEAR